jgi:hypothetical protein
MVELPSLDVLSRREFLRRLTTLGGAAALTTFLESCSIAENSQAIVLNPTTLSGTPTSSTTIPITLAAATEMIQPTETLTSTTATAAKIIDDGKARIAFVKTTLAEVAPGNDLLGINPVTEKTYFQPNFNSLILPVQPAWRYSPLVMTPRYGRAANYITLQRDGKYPQVMDRLGIFQLADDIGL